MHFVRSILARSSTAALVLLLLGVGASAEICDFLGAGADLHDGQLFYRANGSPGWAEMPASGVNLGHQTVSFAYVVSETIENQRAGVVILKFGRTRQPDEPQVDRRMKKVRLLRLAQPFDNKSCGIVTPFGKKAVSAKDYDEYHDAGKSVADNATLDAFHFNYAARRGGCRATNSNVGDTFQPQARSNRGQFSFDTNVVDDGTYWQAFLYIGATTALASSENLEAQQVETRQYRVIAGQPACVRFRHQIPDRAAFLRVNDLEALSSGGYRGPVRAPEHRWPISSP